MSARLSLRIALTIAVALACAGDSRSDKRLGKESLPKYRKQWAVVIGVNYTHLRGAEAAEVPPLKTAEADARAVAERLIKNYGYHKEDIRLLLGKEASAENVRRCFGEGFLGDEDQVTAGDSVLFYFAGHGNRREKSSDKQNYVGLLYPGDVRIIPTRGVDTSSCLRIDEVMGGLNDLCHARHKLVILDSCHSGEVFSFRSNRSAAVNRGFRWDLFKKASFQAIAAARASQVAADAGPNGPHSPFTASLLEALDAGPSVKNRRHFTASELFAFIPHRMSTQPGVRQDPQAGWLHGEGDFYFFWNGVGPPPGPGDVGAGEGDAALRSASELDREAGAPAGAPALAPAAQWLAAAGLILAGLVAAALFLWSRGRRGRGGATSPRGDKSLTLTPEERRLRQIAFPSLTPAQVHTLVQAAEWRDAASGAVVVKTNAILDGLFLIYSGTARVSKAGQFQMDLDDGQFIGEQSFTTGRAATADVIASTQLRYLFWPKERLDELFERDRDLRSDFHSLISADISKKLSVAMRPSSDSGMSPKVAAPAPQVPEGRPPQRSVAPEKPVTLTPEERLLREIVFPKLTPAQIHTLVQAAEWRSAAPGDVVLKGNAVPEGLLLIYSGSAGVLSEETVMELRQGRFIGEMSYMTGAPATADVVANTPLRYLYWPKERLHEVFERDRELMTAAHVQISSDMAHKLAAVTRPTRPSSKNDGQSGTPPPKALPEAERGSRNPPGSA